MSGCCLITGNPIGTATEMVGHPCQCFNCKSNRESVSPAPQPEPVAAHNDELAKSFHEAYERLSPTFGYTSLPQSLTPWDELPEDNKNLMAATCGEVYEELIWKLNDARIDRNREHGLYRAEKKLRESAEAIYVSLREELADVKATNEELVRMVAKYKHERDDSRNIAKAEKLVRESAESQLADARKALENLSKGNRSPETLRIAREALRVKP